MIMKTALKSAVLALSMIHVRGDEAGLLDGAIKNIKAAVRVLEEKEKEAQEHDEAGNVQQDA